MGEFTLDESVVVITGGMESCLCFDCSKDSDMRPDVFVDIASGGAVVICGEDGIADVILEVSPDGLRMCARGLGQAQAHCLSSSTNLNTSSEKGTFLGACVLCTDGTVFALNGHSECDYCGACYDDDELENDPFLVLNIPAWLVGRHG
jgi:hypothetical protein